MSCSPRPVICCTADTSPAANSPWPATMARGRMISVGSSVSLLIVFPKIHQDIRWFAHLTHEPLVESFGGIDSAVLQQMIQRDHFRDHRDVLSRIQRDAHLRELDVENARGFRLQARSVDRRFLI